MTLGSLTSLKITWNAELNVWEQRHDFKVRWDTKTRLKEMTEEMKKWKAERHCKGSVEERSISGKDKEMNVMVKKLKHSHKTTRFQCPASERLLLKTALGWTGLNPARK